MEAFYGILIPFLGTSLGAACVFFMKRALSDSVRRALTGFAEILYFVHCYRQSMKIFAQQPAAV